MIPTLRCWRCGAMTKVDWKDIQAFGDPAPVWIAGRVTCPTPGCVDWDGTDATWHTPPSPQEIQHQADKTMDRFWQGMWGMK